MTKPEPTFRPSRGAIRMLPYALRRIGWFSCAKHVCCKCGKAFTKPGWQFKIPWRCNEWEGLQDGDLIENYYVCQHCGPDRFQAADHIQQRISEFERSAPCPEATK